MAAHKGRAFFGVDDVSVRDCKRRKAAILAEPIQRAFKATAHLPAMTPEQDRWGSLLQSAGKQAPQGGRAQSGFGDHQAWPEIGKNGVDRGTGKKARSSDEGNAHKPGCIVHRRHAFAVTLIHQRRDHQQAEPFVQRIIERAAIMRHHPIDHDRRTGERDRGSAHNGLSLKGGWSLESVPIRDRRRQT